MKTNKRFQDINRNLMLRLTHSIDSELPIYCNSVTNPNDLEFNQTLKQNGLCK